MRAKPFCHAAFVPNPPVTVHSRQDRGPDTEDAEGRRLRRTSGGERITLHAFFATRVKPFCHAAFVPNPPVTVHSRQDRGPDTEEAEGRRLRRTSGGNGSRCAHSSLHASNPSVTLQSCQTLLSRRIHGKTGDLTRRTRRAGGYGGRLAGTDHAARILRYTRQTLLSRCIRAKPLSRCIRAKPSCHAAFTSRPGP
jgi:hypothetical protein